VPNAGALVRTEDAGLLGKQAGSADKRLVAPSKMFYRGGCFISPSSSLRHSVLHDALLVAHVLRQAADEHVYHHAHENWKMYVPLVVLAIGTVFCSYKIFRPLIADAAAVATDSPAVVAIDGEAHESVSCSP